ncbi:MAG: hypothetical protein FWH36_02120 [Lentimicrobiaceae bacterium]|nr:hypothetical protein [Lentimicrobiaceae bacterium]
MKKHIITFVLLGGSVFASAQKNTWTVGLYTGMQGQLTTAVERHYTLKIVEETGETVNIDLWHTDIRTMNRIYSPPAELAVRYNVTDNFSVSSGIGYANYFSQWKPPKYNTWIMDEFAFNAYYRRISVQIPCNLRYDVRLKNTGFSVFSKLGLYMDFSIASYYQHRDNHKELDFPVVYNGEAYNPVFETMHAAPMNNRKFNLLINAGVGIAYQFKSGLGLSLSGEYSVGTMRSEKFNYHLQLKDPDTDIVDYEFDYWIHNRNEYWNVLFGITYAFKQKKE